MRTSRSQSSNKNIVSYSIYIDDEIQEHQDLVKETKSMNTAQVIDTIECFSDITHIVTNDDRKYKRRTRKRSSRIHIVNPNWLKQSIKKKKFMKETKFKSFNYDKVDNKKISSCTSMKMVQSDQHYQTIPQEPQLIETLETTDSTQQNNEIHSTQSQPMESNSQMNNNEWIYNNWVYTTDEINQYLHELFPNVQLCMQQFMDYIRTSQ
jgi:hypothetical protein